ncbi:MAG: ABC transporter permease [bacterium]|nr:ABC transporter permease [bacterium]
MMLFQEMLTQSLLSIGSHKLRSTLTLLGVIIGVTAIIAMMAFINGLQKKITEDITALSGGVFQIQRYDIRIGFSHINPPRTRPPIRWEYVRFLRELPSVANVGAEAWVWGKTVVTERVQTNPNVNIAGGTVEFAVNNGYVIQKGRFFTEEEIEGRRNVAVLGSKLAAKLFRNQEALGQWIRIQGRPFQVIGVFEERGALFEGDEKNNLAAIPLSVFEQIWTLTQGVHITVQARDPSLFEQAMEDARVMMRSLRNLKPQEPDNFAIWNNQQILDTFNNLTKWVKIAAIGITAISLLVAGVGIMNIMLVTVTERTREIGIRKAVGSKKVNILMQFLLEAVVLSQVGAIVGLIFGISIPLLVNLLFQFPVSIPLWTVFLAFLFCSIVGIIFGIWPAMKAANLDPIDALRYE